jgi:DNA replication and repair protein RecF
LSEGVNIIVGPNATGKTNLLEAVLMIARGKSYRAKDAELVQFEQSWARLDARDPDGAMRTVKLQCSEGVVKPGATRNQEDQDHHELPRATCKKSFEIEDKTYLRLSSQKSLPTVLFEPNHLLMLSGSPELRRSYLDDLLEQLTPKFGTMRRQYKRVLAQRNALLKHSFKQGLRPDTSQLFVWNVRLSELAGYMVRERLRLIQNINAIASDIYGKIADDGRSSVSLEYTGHVTAEPITSYESRILKQYDHSLDRDLVIGYTTTGPHRDDFQVRLNGHLVQESASRGEGRTIILTLKVIELRLIEAMALDVASKSADAPRVPLLLLDDVFSELDGKRRHALTDYLRPYQTFITTTDADAVVGHLLGSSTVIPTQRQP